ncbi:SoxR reducing system RseC family protein [Alteromonas gilva]|uniref:SoxR reducing system RseC family protein n=1 Tax=Alteromonas gilva TaxID=2987522 RepID=A0ABT5L6S5_9ALTE|nr:SoxR reducing system RseC family protein [Alteromonas gilva]MDC8832752.1 SoxR reducing system RseC family protein [Alteromonas gilva]
MITETAKVVAVDDDLITVSASVKTGCSQCQLSSDCGTSAVAKAFTPRQQLLSLRSPLPLRVGDHVVIGIPEQRVLLASWLLYIVPLLSLVGSTVLLSQFTAWHELVVFAIGLLLSSASLWLVSRFFKRQQHSRFEPVIITQKPNKALPL